MNIRVTVYEDLPFADLESCQCLLDVTYRSCSAVLPSSKGFDIVLPDCVHSLYFQNGLTYHLEVLHE